MSDLISRQKAIDAMHQYSYYDDFDTLVLSEDIAVIALKDLPSVESDSCYGCKYLGQWENEVEYGYPSPCTRCKRRASDNYELRSKER